MIRVLSLSIVFDRHCREDRNCSFLAIEDRQRDSADIRGKVAAIDGVAVVSDFVENGFQFLAGSGER
jgi:hypothetical protein